MKKRTTLTISVTPAGTTEESGTLRLRKRPIANLTEDQMEDVAGGHPHTCEPTCPPTCCPTCGDTCDRTCPETCGNSCGGTCYESCGGTCFPECPDTW